MGFFLPFCFFNVLRNNIRTTALKTHFKEELAEKTLFRYSDALKRREHACRVWIAADAPRFVAPPTLVDKGPNMKHTAVTVVRLAVEKQDEGCGWTSVCCQLYYCEYKTHLLSHL
jgi:hypothetical protein